MEMSASKRRVAFVTGSTSGIGLGIAHRLASAGHDVIIHGLCPQDVIDAAIEELRRHDGVRISFVSADFAREDEISNLCADIIKLYPEGIDILVNNAGFVSAHPVESYPVATWHKMMAVHLTAPFLLSKFFVPYMKKKGWGRIVNTSSSMGLVSAPGTAPYSVAKSGLIAFAKGLALEVAEHGITCNAICPGYVETDLVKEHIEAMARQNNVSFEQTRADIFEKQIPTKKPATVEQVAALVHFLCSDDAASMTGGAYLMDGGYTAR